ncbi:Zinc finger protein MAGPIE [Apostasia shenzhenica]|uniref:Protein EARLY HEADING DATE 2 n=1 Tax=Apostasia shenzhenica TaxID=1088818 RepID=A0A2I0BGI7_9ASPA|nr:Zinc finger protein MAGPIE [Apostasia shenzhenica]
MSGEAFRIPSILPFHHDRHPNPCFHHQPAVAPQPPANQAKKKRNLPGTPDPEAEVIALSPKTLMATNRFVCEICNKGFQRDQNLQLHRRGHNLPWKLRQRPPGGAPARKRVYVCPEASCVHHDPARALGDLTGIKKHFSRKHGEKKWKCDRCGKRYAVNSDYKAHSKTCGTREYRCDCGTVFSRKDSFVTHRAFCDALTQETAAAAAGGGSIGDEGSYASDEAPAAVPTAKSDLSLWLNRPEVAAPPPAPAAYLSATALLQKAAQMGATTSGGSSSSFFSGLLRSMKGPGYLPSSGGFSAGEMAVTGMTRDFLGLGGEGGGQSLPELTRFAPLGSGVEFVSSSSFNGTAR